MACVVITRRARLSAKSSASDISLRLNGSTAPNQPTASTGPSLPWLTSQPGDVCDASDGQSGPTGLMARAESLAGFAVKIFVKKHKIAPVRVVDEARVAAVARATSTSLGKKDAGKARAKFKSDLTKAHHATGSGGALHLEAISIEMVVAFEGRG